MRLLEVEPDLGEALSSEEFAEARQLAVPVLTIGAHDGDLDQLNLPDAFAALVLEGMVLHHVRVADQLGMHLLGPGDILPLEQLFRFGPVVESTRRAVPETRLAILGRELLLGTRKWPSLLASLQLRSAQQAERLSVQLVICQLPRVDQRLLSLLWLLAESWGRVTPAGTSVPLKLTHEALGALIGARRPTITLALRDLSERGAIVRQTEGWLLLERPQEGTEPAERSRIPTLVEDDPEDTWAQVAPDAATTAAAATANAAVALRDRIATLREQHERSRDQFKESLETLTVVREHCLASRVRIERERVTRRRRRSPSS